ncbi:MAG: 2-C-methyl-D-erythritol 2,4-cyclodiphosphate synthase, partial [Clostridia bacterium]|nr:2-C-methyl-D-erythritol 2,4-cyclodiphosphate synthase [Clostridia bacterium]
MIRVGEGYDVHRLVEGRKCIIGGVDIPFEKGLLGHSDADVLLHAVTDALLGAAGLGDIGRRYPDTDMQWKGADSLALLRDSVNYLRSKGYRPV